MPARPKVMELPEELKTELDRRLLKSGFSGYDDLAKWLTDNGYAISKSALGRYGQKFEERVRALQLATEQARALTEAAPDDEGALSDSLIRLVQEKLFTILVDLQVDNLGKINIGGLTKGIAQLARASVNQKKWQTEFREKIAKTVEETARAQGMSEDQVRYWREKVLGVG